MCLLPLLIHTAICRIKLVAAAVQKKWGKQPRPPAVLLCVANHLALPCVHAITSIGWTCHRVPRLRHIDRAAHILGASAVITDWIPAAGKRASGATSGTLPVILVGPPQHEAVALATGAVLFIPAPIDAPTLIRGLSRIIQGPMNPRSDMVYRMASDPNGLWLDPLTAQIRVGDKWLALPPRQFCILHELTRSPGKLLTTERLCSGLTGTQPMTPGALTICVSRLRKCLRDAGVPDCIETVHRLGYRYAITAAPSLRTALVPARTGARGK